jgi:hypothetical protein
VDKGLEAFQLTLARGGENGPLALSVDWLSTGLGPMDSWPTSLRTALGICFSSEMPMLVGWGEQLVQIYNDAFVPILGPAKHPQALGRSWQQNWPGRRSRCRGASSARPSRPPNGFLPSAGSTR